MFTKSSKTGYRENLPGVLMKPMAWEEKSLLCEFHLKGGHTLPAHTHPYEQTGYLISGKLDFRIADQWYPAEAGDSWCIPENVEHEVKVIEDALVIEVFIPVRTEFLP